MKLKLSLLLFLPILFLSCKNTNVEQAKEEWAIVLHGGAGGGWQFFENGQKAPREMSQERQQEYIVELNNALKVGADHLSKGGSALDAVEKVVIYLENCPLFNAGKGAVMTADGIHELDAAIMDGSNLEAGAIAGVRDVRNPILAARAVMEHSPHVLLIGEGASFFAKEQGLEIVENSYFTTDPRARQLREEKKESRQGEPMGTVGCVALDKNGNLAAATSTGGMSGKKWGRVGDVPIIGAGTYANNEEVAISGTGHGELWIRRVVAYDIYSLMHYGGMNLESAAKDVIWNKIDKMEGSGGGVICVDKSGNIAMEFDTALMYRAWAKSSGDTGAAIY